MVVLVMLRVDPAAGAPTTTTSGATASTTLPRPPACSDAGAPCGSCGPAGQCLEHVDPAPPKRVCVNGGFCVQVDCGGDVQCPSGQVCATLAGLSACCATCP